MDATELVLGIDGGGTKTVAVLATLAGTGDAAVVGRGSAGPGNPRSVGFAAALAAIDEAVAAAFQAAGLQRQAVASACLALAGAGRENEQQQVEAWAAEKTLAEHMRVTNDAEPVLGAGTPDGWGVALIAGTGSLAYGRSPDGATARAGGWGYLFGDEGSGYQLALAGLRAVAKAADGRGPATQLSERFLTRLKVPQPQDLVGVIYGNWDRPAIAALADIVVAAAEDGDSVAATIADESVRELADMIVAVARSLHLDGRTLPLALTGGLLQAQASLQRRLRDRLTRRELDLYPVTVVYEAALGAAQLARRLVQTVP